MKNPIGKFKREKLEEIQLEIESFKEKINLLESFIVDFNSFKDEVSLFMTKFDNLLEEIFPEEEPLTEEDLKKQQEEQLKQFEEVIAAAIMNILNKPENQAAIEQFIMSFQAGPSAFQNMGIPMENLLNKEGELDPLKAIFAWWGSRGKAPKFPGAGQARPPNKKLGGY